MGSRALKSRPGTRTGRKKVIALVLLAVVLFGGLAGYAGAMALGSSWLQDLPDYSDTQAYNYAQKTRVYASDGTTLLAEFYLENREPLDSLSAAGDYVPKGTVDTEDIRFYEHDGVDLFGIARAFVNNLLGRDREGASTITQQFVRNTVLSDEANEATLKRKVREAYISLQLEKMYSKNEILLMYLNTVNYGSGAYGIEAAAQKYFSVSAKDLTLVQAATLVGIPQSPTYNNPIDYPDNCLARRNLVLDRMRTAGDITQEEYDAAVAEPLGLNVSETPEQGIYAYPYFTSYVRQQLLGMYSESEIFKGGLTVTTTLDVAAQDAAEAAAAKKESQVEDDLEVAMVAIDPSTGYVRALVGGKDYAADQYNLATQAQRQPGSSFKTYTLIAGIENGINPQTIIDCTSPITIGTWRVENYDNTNFGYRSIASAFAVSSNTGFARLSTLVTPEKVAEVAKRLGVQTPLNGYQSITLGAEQVTVKDMAQAYATIASGGIQRTGVVIEKVVDAKGKVLYEPDTVGKRVITPEVANAAEKVMEGVVTGGTGTAARLANGQVAAGKTGTTEDFRDVYFAGITPQYAVAIWMGARSERSMSPAYHVADVFSSFLDPLLEGTSIEKFPMANAQAPAYRTLTANDYKILGASYSSSYSNSGQGQSTQQNQQGQQGASDSTGQQGSTGQGGTGQSGSQGAGQATGQGGQAGTGQGGSDTSG